MLSDARAGRAKFQIDNDKELFSHATLVDRKVAQYCRADPFRARSEPGEISFVMPLSAQGLLTVLSIVH